MKTNNPDYLTASSGTTHLQTTLTSIEVKNLSNEKLLIAEEPKSKKGLGMTLTEAIGELEKGYYICNQDEPKDIFYCLYCFDAEVVLVSNNLRMPFHNFKEDAKKDKSVWYIYQPEPLKNTTQQSRVELIEKQRLQIFQDDKTICELKSRNGNLTRIVNDQTERIEVMQHELKNYESAVTSLEGINYSLNKKLDKFEEFNKHLVENETKATESRERLASKFTNWFIFLVLTNVVSIAWNLYLLFK